ncbi:hypothetical protein ACCO45_008018 [Purpureocillium lilacinum]|uniref:Uncharacterized protein n=1 Tax=Purpureocillium lilacinum TaxID=33203 RepID=A0ACC4DQ68_PURLI
MALARFCLTGAAAHFYLFRAGPFVPSTSVSIALESWSIGESQLCLTADSEDDAFRHGFGREERERGGRDSQVKVAEPASRVDQVEEEAGSAPIAVPVPPRANFSSADRPARVQTVHMQTAAATATCCCCDGLRPPSLAAPLWLMDQNRMLTHGAADSLLPTKCSTLSLQKSTLNTGLAFPWQWLAYVSKSFGCSPKSQAYMLIHSTSNFTKLGHLSRRYRRGHRSGSATSEYSYFEFPPYYVDVAHRTKRGLQNSNNARDERRSSTLSSSLRRRLAALALTPDPLD